MNNQYECANIECKKVYDKKQFDCMEKDFCSLVCLKKTMDPIREKEIKDKEELLAKQMYMGNLCGGGAGAY